MVTTKKYRIICSTVKVSLVRRCSCNAQLSSSRENIFSGFPTRSDTNCTFIENDQKFDGVQFAMA